MRPGSLIVFNLNSTLANAAPRYSQAFCDVCEEFGLPTPAPAQIEAALGDLNLAQIMARFAPSLPREARDDFAKSCNETRDALLETPGYRESLYPDVAETLRALSQQGATFGLCTNIGEHAMNAQIAHYGLDEFFPDDMRRGKKDASAKFTHQVKSDAMHYLAQQHHQRGGSLHPMVSIGDSVADYAAATMNGFAFIGFAPPSGPNAVKLNQADIRPVFSSYRDLPSILGGILDLDFITRKTATVPRGFDL